MTTLLDELMSLIRALNDSGIEYAVCGGLALAIHGFSRQTADIDILIRPESLEDVYSLAEREGYDIRELDISFKERAVEIRRVSKIDSIGEVLSFGHALSNTASAGRLGITRINGLFKDQVECCFSRRTN